jgi:hypothetical protein
MKSTAHATFPVTRPWERTTIKPGHLRSRRLVEGEGVRAIALQSSQSQVSIINQIFCKTMLQKRPVLSAGGRAGHDLVGLWSHGLKLYCPPVVRSL